MDGERHTLANPDRTVPAGTPETSLYSEGAFPGEMGTVLAPPGSTVRRIPGTPYLDPASGQIDGALHPAAEQIERAAEEFRAAAVPGRGGTFHDMAETAVLDLLALRQANGAVLGAGSSYWRFVWPRDNGLTAAALSVSGYQRYAVDALRYVFGMQEEDGQFEARYLPDGSGHAPDDRGRQHDGIGYTLWATDIVTARAPGSPDQVDPVIRDGALRALRAGIALLDPQTGLPAPSQDYWEMDLETISLGVAAPLLAGIEAGVRLARRWGAAQDAEAAERAACALAAAITSSFGPVDYQRFSHGGGRDASIALLLPPFRGSHQIMTQSEITTAWKRAMDGMRISNGGLRPGEQWEDDQTAWTPQISLFAMTATALGERDIALDLLTWLDHHRTALGCLPEKVTARGTPAAVAPINCVAAATLLALAQLEGRVLLP
jgi:hypothetical protein